MPNIGGIWLRRDTKPCSATICGESIIQSRAVVVGIRHIRENEKYQF